MESLSSKLQKSPRENAGLISKLFFCWLIKIFRLGGTRELEIEDLYHVLPEDSSHKLGNNLEKSWQNELKRYQLKKTKRPSFLKAILKVFGPWYAFLGVFPFFEECIIRTSQPILLGYLIRYFNGEFETREGFLFAAGVILASALYITMHHPFFFAVQHVGMNMRVSASALIYRKALRLSQAALGDATVGQLVNFLSNDVNRLDVAPHMSHYVWVAPLQLGVVIFILWSYYGPVCLAGAALLVVFAPFQSLMGHLFGKVRLKVAEKTDKRIRLMNEIISAIRVIKMYTWEIPFSQLVSDAREQEVKFIRDNVKLRSLNFSSFYVSSKLVVFATLLAYVLTGNYLNAEKVFVTLALYNNVRVVLTLFFPLGISQFAELLVSLKRIETFLLMEERVIEKKNASTNEIGVKLTNLSAKWSSSDVTTLKDISLEVRKGQLIAVIGTVGCSKSSLIQAILQELPKISGSLEICGNIAYSAQEPWVFSGSVKQNIVFGSKYQEAWYDQVIEACALRKDLELLQYGDNTIVGDRGTSLSGGQKARINLARAVYANRDIYLLDDPLSAVDAEVGRLLFEKCIMGIIRTKATILVTHQLQFLKAADHIILLNDGKVECQGTFRQLLDSGIDFAQLLQADESSSSNQPSDVLASSSSITNKIELGKPEYRRISSMGMGEMNMFGDYSVPEEFDPDEKSISMSLSMIKSVDQKTASGKHYGTFTKTGAKAQTSHDETKAVGEFGFGLYWKYIRAGCNWCTFLILVSTNIVTQVFFTGSDYWLQFWTGAEESLANNIILNGSVRDASQNHTVGDEDKSFIDILRTDRDAQIWIYCGIMIVLFIVSLVRTLIFFNICMNSSVVLHKRLFKGVIRAPMRFFEVNPVGRVLNRFAKDIGIIDETLPPTLFDTMEVGLQVIGILIIVSVVNPIFIVPSLVLAVLFHYIRRFYLLTARGIKRLEGIARSPVFTHLSSSLYGLSTIRAFGVEKDFELYFDEHQDLHSSTWYLFLSTARWLGICVDWISVFYVATVTLILMLLPTDGPSVGLAISSAMSLTGLFQWGVRQSAETENQMVSVERVLEYSDLAPEPQLESAERYKPSSYWPENGEISLQNIFVRYGDDEPVLKDVTVQVKGGEKVGIVGRTGSGKTSLISTIFSIVEPYSGSILIDNVDVLKIGLHDLRSKISIIPQDPQLFTGSIRRNFDPFGYYKDHEIWKVLNEVYLAETVREMPARLDSEVLEGGSNFSVGQRQLVCLGRAILRKNKILILDEATASVDPETDALIQKTIREKFKECTVLTIAHRLHTVMDSDRILLLDAGRVKEFDEPYKLIRNHRSALYQLIKQTGKGTAKFLENLAFQAYKGRNAGIFSPTGPPTLKAPWSQDLQSVESRVETVQENLDDSSEEDEIQVQDNKDSEPLLPK